MKTRYYGIDLLRIICMLMIVMLHILDRGGVLKSVNSQGGLKYLVAWGLEVLCYGAVNCYAMISGFLSYKSKVNNKKLLMFWLQIIFYTLSITVLYTLFIDRENIGVLLVKAIFPILTGQYWYMTAYFGLFLLMPVLNAGLSNLSEKDAKRIFVFIILFFSVLPAIFSNFKDGISYISLNEGYSVLWIVLLYILGAVLNKFNIENLSIKRLTISYLLLTFLTPILKFVLGDAWFTYTSPTILLPSIFLFILCMKVKISKQATKNILVKVSATTLGIYLLHAHPLIFDHALQGSFKFMAHFNWFILFFALLFTSVCIFVVCSLIELARIKLFAAVTSYLDQRKEK